MPGAIKVDDIVVLIPGIMGSVLKGPNGDEWAPSADAVLNALLTDGGDLQNLALKGPGNHPNPDGVYADRLFPDAHLIPGFWTIDGYTKIADSLQATLDITLGQNYFEFPYDWRLDNRVAAKQLQAKCGEWLAAWRGGTHSNAKLILIAHSMGGLIARYFIECLGGWTDTRMLITFGTPFHGSVKALHVLSNGLQIKVGPITVFDFSSMIRTFPSAYQLLPDYPCIDMGDGKGRVRLAEVQAPLPNIAPERLQDSINFYREMATKVAENEQLPGYGYQIHALVGTEQETQLRGEVANGAFIGYNDYPPEHWQGDTTVPWISAHPLDHGVPEFGTYYPECHGSIQNGDDVLMNVRNLIEALTSVPWGPGVAAAGAVSAPEAAPAPIPVQLGQSGIAVQMSEMYVGPSVDISVLVPLNSPAFADVTDVTTGRMIHQRLSLSRGPGDVQTAALNGLAQAVYRIRLYSDDPTIRQITNLFTVVMPA
jgi:hypothetical protein